jgi:hypothetical protein
MKKQEIIDLLTKNHASFVAYMNELKREEFEFAHQEKWSAGQQLAHIVLCVKPLVKVFGMDKEVIAQNFGLSNRESASEKVLFDSYKEKLSGTYKTADRYLPEVVLLNQRQDLTENLTKLIQSLCVNIASFTETELDSLFIPHPLLGNLTLREMLYNAIHHVEHHQEATKNNLKKL